MSVDLDPRWDWIDVTTLGGSPEYVKGACRHVEVVPVTDADGAEVAQLCRTCDTSFPPSREPTP